MKNVSSHALIARINRKLAHDHQRLCKCRERSRLRHDVGEYYLLDTYRNAIANYNVDVVNLGRELGVLHEREVVA